MTGQMVAGSADGMDFFTLLLHALLHVTSYLQ